MAVQPFPKENNMAYSGYGLPGRFLRAAKQDELCEVCDGLGKRVPATKVIQGETDSWGHEEIVCCDACNTRMQEEDRDLGTCEWCKKEPATRRTRDADEGSSGPVYHVCGPCDRRKEEHYREELRFLACQRKGIRYYPPGEEPFDDQ
jgi:hypothetical protein